MRVRINFPGFSRNRLRLLVAFFFWLLPAFSAPVFAAWYQVEVILFEYTEPDTDGELWYENPGLPGRDGSIELIMGAADDMTGETMMSGYRSPVADDATGETMELGRPDSPDDLDLMPYLALPEEYYRLDGVDKVLKLSREYRPLLHVTWQQPGLDSRNVRAIHLDNTLFEEKTTEQTELTWPELAKEWVPARKELTSEDDAAPAEPEWDWPVYTPPELAYDGLIRLRSSRFLHLDVDFAYFPELPEEPAPDLSAAEEATSVFEGQSADYVRLTESRRIKLNEIHYFDHPMFGLIIQVSRLKIKDQF